MKESLLDALKRDQTGLKKINPFPRERGGTSEK
jgi:hypothetical protein